ncbi:hypothetical protein [Tenacibaculum sp. 190524A05c]|uniref:hypothetical protein n=1 Tax=Tenacibaculum platacis TaxID=3137852 RepID=UPI0032B1B157
MKTKRLLLGIAISTLLLANCSKENNNIDDCTGCSLVSYNTIEEFFEENGVPTQDFSVDGANGGSITGDQGTIITFQPNSFLDQNGTVVTGNVDIKIKEIFSASDMVLSNRPTNAVNPGGENTFLLSEGETEILAEQNGAPLNLAPGNSIRIRVPSSGGADPAMGAFLGTVNADDNIVWNQFFNTEVIFQSAPDSYLYDVFDMGWTNCDKFYSYPGAKTTNYVDLTSSPNIDEARVFIIFKENNLPAVVSFTQTYSDGVQSYVNSLPVGLEVTYVGLTIKDNQQYMATKTVTIQNDEYVNLEFSPVSTDEIKDALELLN